MTRSIVMADWSLKNTPNGSAPEEFIWQQILLSILYDEVLVQDQTLLLSNKLAKWFPDNERFSLLEELVECGGLTVLKHPVMRYPEALRDKARQSPIGARREQLQSYSNNNYGKPIQFSESLVQFHNRLELLLGDQKTQHREAGKKSKSNNLMQEFGIFLKTVLTDMRYESWLHAEFPKISVSTREQWAGFISDPANGITRLADAYRRMGPGAPPLPRGDVLTKAFAAQLASTYEGESANLRKLVESVFAMTFCQDEASEGRYNQYLRPMPFAGKISKNGQNEVNRVETTINVPLNLPLPRPGFSKTICLLKEKDSVKELRSAMNDASGYYAFQRVECAWRAVSADLASISSGRELKEINMQLLLMSTVRGLVWGAVVDNLMSPPTDLKSLLLRQVPSACASFSSLGGSLLTEVLPIALKEDRMRKQIERAVEFKCVQHPTVEEDKTQGAVSPKHPQGRRGH